MAGKASDHARFDFELLYKSYPRKEGKTGGMKRLAKEIRSPEDYAQFGAAVLNYAKLCRRDQRAREYIKLWSTFAGCWRDYINGEDFQLPRDEDAGVCRQYASLLQVAGLAEPHIERFSLRVFARFGADKQQFIDWISGVLSSPKAQELEKSNAGLFQRYLYAALDRETGKPAGEL